MENNKKIHYLYLQKNKDSKIIGFNHEYTNKIKLCKDLKQEALALLKKVKETIVDVYIQKINKKGRSVYINICTFKHS